MHFKYSIENLRGLSILFVMFSHVSSFYSLGLGGQFLYFLVGDATSWFVFISGYLFYHIENKKFRYSQYFWKKVRYVILPYFILSLPAILIGLFLGREKLIGLSKTGYVLWSLVVGGAVIGPMWFIPMIVIFFVFSPLINGLANSRAIYFFAVVGICFSVFSFRPIGNLNPFLAFFHFLGFYLLGIAAAVSSPLVDLKMHRRNAVYLALFTFVMFLVSSFFYLRREESVIGFFDGLGTFNLLQFGKLSLLITIYILFGLYLERSSKVLSFLARISFGLFFVHGFYIAIFAKGLQIAGTVSPTVTVISEVLAVVLGSIVTVPILKILLGGKSRYVIGC